MLFEGLSFSYLLCYRFVIKGAGSETHSDFNDLSERKITKIKKKNNYKDKDLWVVSGKLCQMLPYTYSHHQSMLCYYLSQ